MATGMASCRSTSAQTGVAVPAAPMRLQCSSANTLPHFTQAIPLARPGRTVTRQWTGAQLGQRRRATALRALADDSDDIDAARMSLDRMMSATSSTTTLTGQELRRLVFEKWSRSFDVRLIQRSGVTHMHIMWKFLEQASFPLTSEEYQEQLDAVAELCALWGVSDIVRQGISNAHSRGPGYSVGGGAKAIQITLGRNLSMLETGR